MKTITIAEEEYNRLVEDSEFLEALRDAGVDNWSGFDVAVETLVRWRLEEESEDD